MKTGTLATAVVLALACGIAAANSCPAEMSKIDAALAKTPKISNAQMAEVMKYRNEGEALHKAGKHAESMQALGKAKQVLQIK